MKISIVILTYNSARYIPNLLESLFGKFDEKIKEKELEILVVDNASGDDTLKLAEKVGGSKVKIIKNSGNLGFAKGINSGVRHASGEYIVLINPDSEYKSGDLFDAVKKFESDEKIGIIGGAMLNRAGNYEKSAGRFIKTSEVFLMLLGADEALGVRKSPGQRIEVDFVSGGFMMFSKKLFEELGGFDEDFFMYIEDMELCYRVKRRGLKVIYDPEIVTMHVGQGSSNRGFAFKNIFKGLVLFQKKHGNALSAGMVKSMLLVKSVLLVMLGKIINNKSLSDTYAETLKM